MWQIEQSLKVKLVWAALMWGDDKKMPAHEKRAPPARVRECARATRAELLIWLIEYAIGE